MNIVIVLADQPVWVRSRGGMDCGWGCGGRLRTSPLRLTVAATLPQPKRASAEYRGLGPAHPHHPLPLAAAGYFCGSGSTTPYQNICQVRSREEGVEVFSSTQLSIHYLPVQLGYYCPAGAGFPIAVSVPCLLLPLHTNTHTHTHAHTLTYPYRCSACSSPMTPT